MANYAQYNYLANTGLAKVSTANSNLDGTTGAYETVITGAANGTIVKTLIIKAQTDTVQGMVRIFVKKAGMASTTVLLSEFNIPPIIKSGRDISYYNVIPLNYTLQSGEVMTASTEKSDTFNIIAEGLDYSYAASAAYLASSLEYISNSGGGRITTANTNLNGTGSTVQIIIASSSAGDCGCLISSIVIKAQQTTSPGMVRLYIADTSGGANPPVLFCEVAIPSVVQSATTQTFSCQVIGQGGLNIAPGYSIYASTEVSNNFSIGIEGADWKYV